MENNQPQVGHFKTALAQTMRTLMEVSPSHRNSIEKFLEKIDGHNISQGELVKEAKSVGMSVLQEKDNQAIEMRVATQNVHKHIGLLLANKHISAKQRETLEQVKKIPSNTPAEAMNALHKSMQTFAEEALHHRQNSKVVVGDEHQKLKKSESNIIAGDVAWSSKQIINSLNPLLKRLFKEFPDNTKIKSLLDRLSELKKKAAVDFFEALNIMDESLHEAARLQGQRTQAEANYLKGFHEHLKSMHNALSDSIKGNSSFQNASDKDKDALLKIINGFQDNANTTDDPEKLKKMIADNVNSMKEGVNKVMNRQEAHIRNQQREMESLRVDIREQEKQSNKLQKEFETLNETLADMSNMSLTDSLTGAANRRAYDISIESLDESILQNKIEASRSGMLIVDIDKFKLLNDEYGHAVGDKILLRVVQMLKKIIKQKEYQDNVDLFRYGGEEFVFVYSNLDMPDVIKLAEICRRHIESRKFTLKGQEIRVTASFGISAYQNKKSTGKTVFEAADKALYAAKNNGRNTIVYIKDGRMRASTKPQSSKAA
jgi:diguanylate cyclase (GGDEF)-like protein